MVTLRRTVAVLATTVATTAALTISPAMADGLHIFQNDPRYLWGKGCTVSYTLSADMPAEYATAISEGLNAIGQHTAMTFILVPETDKSPARISYSINPNLPNGAAGLGSTGGTVELAPLDKLPDWRDPAINANIRKNLVVHETLHVFGLSHDLDETDPNGPDEIMYPILPVTPLSFGNGDLTGMAAIKEKNKCGTPQAIQPNNGQPTVTPPTMKPPTTNSVAKQKCLMKNQKIWKWNAKKKKCVRR